ncbi:MAG: penicillin-binding protein 2 [Chloroflexi bacterium]|nr:penicillin-binding protein 2 [Chloroflexota bacterium]
MKRQPHTWRYLSVAFLLAVLGIAILVQIVRIQNSPEVAGVINQGDYVWKDFFPPRGEIHDRHGSLLAGNKTVYEIGLDLTVNPDMPTVMLALQMSGIDLNEVNYRISLAPVNAQYIILDDFVSTHKAEQLMTLQKAAHSDPTGKNLDAVYFKAHYARSYPENDLASNVLGFVTEDNHGYLGIEEKYDNILAGIPVRMLVPADPRRATEYPTIPPGQTIILTIDRKIQAAIEKILDQALVDTGASSGTIVVMDPLTGEILAMSSTPRLNLNDYQSITTVFPGETPFNRAISQAYEPGSVSKILTMAGALDSGAVQPGTVFFDTGSILVGGFRIVNWDGGAWGNQDMTGCLANSLNVCLAWVSSTQMGSDSFYSYMQRFGLGHATGIDLAQETSGRLKLPGDGDWRPVELGTNAFGQGVSVTPIQMVMAASALANDGQMVYPHVLYAQIQAGKQSNTKTQIVGTPISANTADTISEMLANALETESSAALIPGYRIAGKTGTAQIPLSGGGYDENDINATFIGWGPVDDPRFIVYVWLEKPQSNRAASVVAAPIFKQVVEKLVVLMDVPPDVVRLQMTVVPGSSTGIGR